MATGVLNYMQNVWPFSLLKFDDLKASAALVQKLSVPEHTKQFVFAIREPESQAVIYILCVQNLSERSAMDVEYLIREVRPDAVVAQVGQSMVNEILCEEIEFRDDVVDPVPTSTFEVLKRCFVDKLNKEKYENVAGSLALREIFGIGFHGNLLTAQKVAEEAGSSFLLLESPVVNCGVDSSHESVNLLQALAMQASCLIPQKVVPLSSRKFCLPTDLYVQMLKSMSLFMTAAISDSKVASGDIRPSPNYVVPPFAQSVYPLLVDLHDMFQDIPSIERALAQAQKIFCNVNRGEAIDSQLLSEVYIFRIAVEGLRIALNNAGRIPFSKLGNPNSAKIEFSDLPVEDKSHALLAEALRSQTKKFKSMVAIVEASCLAGLRKHWNTPVPAEVKHMVEELVTDCSYDCEIQNNNDKRKLLSSKPVVAVGVGATAVLGVSSLSKVVPVSTFMKVLTLKVPASLKLVLAQTQKIGAIAFGKTLGPSKVVAPGIVNTGAKTASMLKATVSAEKIRVVTHGVIASAEKTSISAMRTAFYEIMRKRRVRPIGFLPWATFGCSVATCTGLLFYGDGIECAAESFPAAPSIANLGRGIQSLHQASQAASHVANFRIQKSIESLLHRFKKI